MIIKLGIGCVNSNSIEYTCFEKEDALRFLKEHDHEGSSIDVRITGQDKEVYELLEDKDK